MSPTEREWRGLRRLELTPTPTPLDRAERLSDHVGAEIWIKRDDVGAIGVAGNKIRKLEFLLAAALAEGADTLIIVGARQSNAARATAASAALLGLECHLVVDGDGVGAAEGNLLLDQLFGAVIHPSGVQDWAALERRARDLEEELARDGRHPFRMPVGCSSPMGAVGFACAYEELLQQLDEEQVVAESIYHASTSGGTHAGLVLGRKMMQRGPRIHGIDVGDLYEDAAETIASLAREAGALIAVDHEFSVEAVEIESGHMGRCYGSITEQATAAIALTARLEGVVADPVYSGKALGALLEDATRGRIKGPVVFWHTGGTPACFAMPYQEALVAAAGAAESGPGEQPG